MTARRGGGHPLVAIVHVPLAGALLGHPHLAVLVGHPDGAEAIAVLLLADMASGPHLLEATELPFGLLKVHGAPLHPGGPWRGSECIDGAMDGCSEGALVRRAGL